MSKTGPFLVDPTLPVNNGVNYGKRKREKLFFTTNDENLRVKTEIYIKKCRQGLMQPHLTDFDKNLYILQHRNRAELNWLENDSATIRQVMYIDDDGKRTDKPTGRFLERGFFQKEWFLKKEWF